MDPERFAHSHTVPAFPHEGIIRGGTYDAFVSKDEFTGSVPDNYTEDAHAAGGMLCDQSYLTKEESAQQNRSRHNLPTSKFRKWAAIGDPGMDEDSEADDTELDLLLSNDFTDADLSALDDPSYSQQWIIPQKPYAGKKPYSAQAPLPVRSMEVDVSTSKAIVPERLAQSLRDPLSPGFPDDTEGPDTSRKGEKFTVRIAFIDDNGDVARRREPPKQNNEYASACRQMSDPYVKAAQDLCGVSETSRKDSRSKPLIRCVLVGIVVQELRDLMAELEARKSPLTFRGVQVNFRHLNIVRIDRPTPATVQPVLEISLEFRHLYPLAGGEP